MRLSDADRERLFELLARHHAEGRLSVEELERRVGVVAAAMTRADVSEAVDDLPPLPGGPAADPVPGPEPRRRFGRGHGEAERPAADWRPTSERFIDPKSRRVLRVWVDAAGSRHYVPDQD